MSQDTTCNEVKLTLYFTSILETPFEAQYGLNPIKLDPDSFLSKDLESLKSITVAAHSSSDSPDLEISSIFELSIDTNSRGYGRIIDAAKPGPPIKNEEYYRIEDQHKTLVYAITKYIAWRNDVHVGEVYPKVIQYEMKWEFGGTSSTEQPRPSVYN